MGLDIIELVMGVESAFLIEIPDEDAMRIRTPRQVVDYVSTRVDVSDRAGGACLTQRAFHRLRRATADALERPRGAITPQSVWDDLLPSQGRRRQWRRLGESVGTPEWPSLTLFGGFLPGVETVAGTARFLGEWAAASLKEPGEAWRVSEVERSVRRVLVDVAGVDDFCWDDDFVRDLGLD